VVTFLLLFLVIIQTWPTDAFPAPPVVAPDALRGSVSALGVYLVSPDAYVLPFELASVLLLAALVGAIVVAWPEKES
jgi:NADH-quinone oxidoreductase subunit J